MLTRACDRVLRRVPVSLSVSAVRFMLYVYVRCVLCVARGNVHTRGPLSSQLSLDSFE